VSSRCVQLRAASRPQRTMRRPIRSPFWIFISGGSCLPRARRDARGSRPFEVDVAARPEGRGLAPPLRPSCRSAAPTLAPSRGRPGGSRRERAARRSAPRTNLTEALSSAAELEHVGLAEALELCLLLVERDPERFSDGGASLARTLLPRSRRRWLRRGAGRPGIARSPAWAESEAGRIPSRGTTQPPRARAPV
jgi:hypothetical protein